MKLISTTDFVLQQGLHSTLMMEKGMILCNKYANFLKKPLELGMFVPCDEDGNVLEKPNEFASVGVFEYQQAKERVLFKGVEYSNEGIKELSINGKVIWFKNAIDYESWYYQTIEDLIPYELELTESAIKQIGYKQ